ncbi:TPA: DNA-binding protein [Legionella bozemanae]|uniref:DNA-binding protein n=1 Tax=Legionella bozemanae TaxID=447 RepID=UPI001041AFEA|nr:DNA-binding protein [Legionella bozemanae]
MKTMNILQASQFLGVHKESLRRRWIFIEQDLVMHIRNKYSTCDASQGAYAGSNKEWPSTKEMEFGGLISATKEKEYAKALGLK